MFQLFPLAVRRPQDSAADWLARESQARAPAASSPRRPEPARAQIHFSLLAFFSNNQPTTDQVSFLFSNNHPTTDQVSFLLFSNDHPTTDLISLLAIFSNNQPTTDQVSVEPHQAGKHHESVHFKF